MHSRASNAYQGLSNECFWVNTAVLLSNDPKESSVDITQADQDAELQVAAVSESKTMSRRIPTKRRTPCPTLYCGNECSLAR